MTDDTPISSFDFPHPPSFDGSHDGYSVLMWTRKICLFFVGANIPDDQKTLHAAKFLTGTALQWWEDLGMPGESPYNDFEHALIAEFSPPQFLDHVLQLLISVKFESNLNEYINQIRKYLFVLYSQDGAHQQLEMTVRAAFLKGCPNDLQKKLLIYEIGQTKPASFDELLHVARRFDNIFHFKPDGSSGPMLHQ